MGEEGRYAETDAGAFILVTESVNSDSCADVDASWASVDAGLALIVCEESTRTEHNALTSGIRSVVVP